MIYIKKSKLNLEEINANTYRAIFKTRHARIIYLELKVENNMYEITKCFYTDRDIDKMVAPLKLKAKRGNFYNLLAVLDTELDKKFYGINFLTYNNTEMKDYINAFLKADFKYRFLIFIKDGNILKTRLKNKNHRSVYLEISLDGDICTIINCHYYDRSYKRDITITPYGLTSIKFNYYKLLNTINKELCCNFTDIIITADSFGFENSYKPICGCI